MAFILQKVFARNRKAQHFRHFSKLARPLQSLWHPQEWSGGRFKWIGKIPMFGFSQVPARFTAAVSAFALSLALIGATVSMPSQAQAQTSGAYVGVVA